MSLGSKVARGLAYAAGLGGVAFGGNQLTTYNKYNQQSIHHKQTIEAIHEQVTKNAKEYQGLDKEQEIQKVCDQFLPERHDDVIALFFNVFSV
jgi:hypothetical protein